MRYKKGDVGMNLVVAVDEHWGIGNKGDLLARIRGDLKNFATLTTGKTVILGANTLATFPGGRVLKNRTNIVMNWDPAYAPEGAIVAHSMDELFEILKAFDTDDVFVIGGASIYRQLLPFCKNAYITKIHGDFEKDAYFRNLDEDPDWICESESELFCSLPEDQLGKLTDGTVPDQVSYTFTVYTQKNMK